MDVTDSDREARGPNAPSEALAAAIQLLQLVRERLGFSSASRESVVEALGYKSLNGTSRRKLAALNHFDLLVRSGAAYRISDLGKQILIPRDETEHRQALAIAARSPAFYQRLFAKYEGQALPGMLPNILVREFGILPQSSEEVARTFRETQEFAGLLKNGILLAEPESMESSRNESSTRAPLGAQDGVPRTASDESMIRNPPIVSPLGDRQYQRYTIPLDKQGSLAGVELPIPLKDRDLKKVSAWINYMLTVVEDDEAVTPSDIGLAG